jgi:peptide subunit release factor RF-3
LHTNQIIIGAVGQLQFEVFEHRLKNEYNVDVVMGDVLILSFMSSSFSIQRAIF